jgi:hypothetical protein
MFCAFRKEVLPCYQYFQNCMLVQCHPCPNFQYPKYIRLTPVNSLEAVIDGVRLPLTRTCRSGTLLYISLYSRFQISCPLSVSYIIPKTVFLVCIPNMLRYYFTLDIETQNKLFPGSLVLSVNGVRYSLSGTHRKIFSLGDAELFQLGKNGRRSILWVRLAVVG